MAAGMEDDLTNRVITCAMKVHGTLGSGYQEVIYQRALAIELVNQGISFQREVEVRLFYDEQDIGTCRVDFVVEQTLIVELKAVNQLEAVHFAQGLNFLAAFSMDIGLMVNFGAQKLETKTLTLPEDKA
ncbi:MAG: GxxExxY protein [Sphingobacteriaceae bacterium]